MGDKIKKRRKKLGMSMADLAEKTGLSTTYISNLENNNRNNPSKEAMDKIAYALKSTVPQLFYE